MLIKCPECELQISDKALSCPHCGFPLKQSKQYKRPTKYHKRLPNGFGRITEIKNRNLRNPFRITITVGKDDNGRPIGKVLSYHRTYNEAYEALIEYHKNPYDIDESITVKELYKKWSEQYFKTLKSDSSCRVISSAWSYCSSLENIKVRDIRPRHIKTCLDEGFLVIKCGKLKGERKYPSAGTKARIKSMWNLMLDYAVEYEMTDKNYSRTFEISQDIIQEKESNTKRHLSYTPEEISLLWSYAGKELYIDMVLIQCYSGWRPQELCLLKTADVNINKFEMKGGMKTESGTDRIVPIHPAIRDLVKKIYNEATTRHQEYLFEDDGPLTYDRFSKKFCFMRDSIGLNINHRPHDGRKQFVTMAKNSGVDEYAIKRIVGHKISDITERIYTDRDPDWLMNEISKIKGPGK